MAKYINRAELQERVAQYFVDFNTDKYDIYKDVVEVIEETPTIDIVRCKDCKYCKVEDWDGDNFRVCTRDQHIRSGSWFCADGERRK